MSKKHVPHETQPYLLPDGYPIIAISAIAPYEKNPRKNDNAVRPVQKSIENFGFLVPVVLDAENNLAAGHTRVKGAAALGGTHVPYIRAEHLTEAQIKAFRLADNRVGDYAEWDYELLAEELESLKEYGEDELNATGFTATEIERYSDLTSGLSMGNADVINGLEGRYDIIVICETEEKQLELMEQLMEQGHDVRAMV